MQLPMNERMNKQSRYSQEPTSHADSPNKMFSSSRASQQRHREARDRHERNTRPGNLSIGGRLRALHQAREDSRTDAERRRLEIQQRHQQDRRQNEQPVEERDQNERYLQPECDAVGGPNPTRSFGQVVAINVVAREALIKLEPESPSSRSQLVPAGIETRVGDWLPWLEDSEALAYQPTASNGQRLRRNLERNVSSLRYHNPMESQAGQTEGLGEGAAQHLGQTVSLSYKLHSLRPFVGHMTGD